MKTSQLIASVILGVLAAGSMAAAAYSITLEARPKIQPAAGKYEITAEKVSAESDFSSGGNKNNNNNTENGDYLCEKSSRELLTDADVKKVQNQYPNGLAGESTAQMMVNEIFARHGRPFKKPLIRQYFSSKSWYNCDNSLDDASIEANMSPTEKENINFLKRYY